MGYTIKRTEFQPLESGIYPATVGDVTLEEGKFGQQLKLKFNLDDAEELGEDRSLIGWCSATFSPKSKLYGWTRALLFGGRDIPEEFGELDVDTLKGRRCMLSVGTKKGDDGTVFNKITDLLPIRPVKTAARPAPANAQPPAGQARAAAVVNTGAATPGDVPSWLAGVENDGEDMPF